MRRWFFFFISFFTGFFIFLTFVAKKRTVALLRGAKKKHHEGGHRAVKCFALPVLSKYLEVSNNKDIKNKVSPFSQYKLKSIQIHTLEVVERRGEFNR